MEGPSADRAHHSATPTHDDRDVGGEDEEEGECASYSMTSEEEDDSYDGLDQEVSITKLLVDLPLPVQHELMLEESKRSIHARLLDHSEDDGHDHSQPHKFDKFFDARSIQTGEDTVDDEFSCSEDSEDQFYRTAVDWEKKREAETRKSVLIAVLGGSGMGMFMGKVTLVVKFVARLFAGGGEDTMAVLVDIGGDPAENVALMKFMGQEMAVQASKSAGSAMASGTSSSAAATSSLGALGTTTAVGTSGSTVAMVTAVTVVATVASMVLLQPQPVILPVMNNTNICQSDSQHEFKHGYIRLGMKLVNHDTIVDKRAALEDMFVKVYHEVIPPCLRDYERVLETAELFHADLELQDDNTTTNSNSNSSFTRVYTQWVAQVSCNGCLDIEPLFTNAAMLDDHNETAGDHNETAGDHNETDAGSRTNRRLRRRSLIQVFDDPETQQVLLQNNTLFRQFLASYNVAIRQQEKFQNQVYYIYYGALLTPTGELVEEVVLEEVLKESRELLPPPTSAPTTPAPKPRTTVVASIEWTTPPSSAPTIPVPKPRTVVASMEWTPPPTSAPTLLATESRAIVAPSRSSSRSTSKSKSSSMSSSDKNSSKSKSSSMSSRDKSSSKSTASRPGTSKSKMSTLSSSAAASMNSQSMMGSMVMSSKTRNMGSRAAQRLDPFQ